MSSDKIRLRVIIRQTPVCVLSDIKSGIILCFFRSFFLFVSLSFSGATDTCISATVTPTGLFLRDGRAIIWTGLLPFGDDIFRGHRMRGQEVGSGGPFFCLSRHRFCHLTANISKAVSRNITCQLQLTISLTRAF